VSVCAAKTDEKNVKVYEAQMPMFPMRGMGMGGMGMGMGGMGMMPQDNFGQQEFAIDYSEDKNQLRC
jgi:hypothetical protein